MLVISGGSRMLLITTFATASGIQYSEITQIHHTGTRSYSTPFSSLAKPVGAVRAGSAGLGTPVAPYEYGPAPWPYLR